MLLQVMSEERPTGFQTVPAGKGRKQIINIGTDPWLVKQLAGSVKLNRADAGDLKVVPLDGNGYPLSGKQVGNASQITLESDAIYYSIER
jgi:hypothetical protein